MEKERTLLVMWWEGKYALGWRGQLAMWLLKKPIKDFSLNEVFFTYTTAPKEI